MQTVYPDDQEAYISVVKETNKTLSPYTIEYCAVLADGTVRHVLESVEPEIIAGTPTGKWRGVTQDFTELRKAEDRLGKQETDQQLASEMVDLGYWVFDVSSRIVRSNSPTYARILGIPFPSVQAGLERANGFVSLIHPEDVQQELFCRNRISAFSIIAEPVCNRFQDVEGCRIGLFCTGIHPTGRKRHNHRGHPCLSSS